VFQDGTFDGISSGRGPTLSRKGPTRQAASATQPRRIQPHGGHHPPRFEALSATSPDQLPRSSAPERTTKPSKSHCRRKVAYKQFQVLLTLLPKAFSSFAHATCSLSVSRPYLALEGIYLPLCASIPKNTTLENDRGRRSSKPNRAVTFSGVAFQQTWA